MVCVNVVACLAVEESSRPPLKRDSNSRYAINKSSFMSVRTIITFLCTTCLGALVDSRQLSTHNVHQYVSTIVKYKDFILINPDKERCCSRYVSCSVQHCIIGTVYMYMYMMLIVWLVSIDRP